MFFRVCCETLCQKIFIRVDVVTAEKATDNTENQPSKAARKNSVASFRTWGFNLVGLKSRLTLLVDLIIFTVFLKKTLAIQEFISKCVH